MQRDLVLNLKREIYLNIGVISRLTPMPSDLTRQIFKENVLEKPTQNVFNHISHYLVCIIDPAVAEKFSWPLYDSKTERVFRSQLSAFVNDYSSKGLLSPVMSSYLVNPGCYKVTMLLFQMTQLAVLKLNASKMTKGHQQERFDKMTELYNDKTYSIHDLVMCIEEDTERRLFKVYNYQEKVKALERIAEMFRHRIIKMEDILTTSKAQDLINNLVDQYINNNSIDKELLDELKKIKNVKEQSAFFETWLNYLDSEMNDLERNWDEKVSPFLKLCSDCKQNTESLINRHTGEAEKSSYMIEYNHTTDEICTKELQTQVNSEQQYILKNIVCNGRLNFPNLIKGYLISICYILKNTEISDEIYKFNEYLESRHISFEELISGIKAINHRVMTVDSKLKVTPLEYDETITVKGFEIPLLPNLTDLKANREHSHEDYFESFTPFSLSKHEFNLLRKHNSFSFAKPQLKSFAPFISMPAFRDEYNKSMFPCRFSTYDQPMSTQNFLNISVIPQANQRVNETISDCSAGFTKQQLMRLLSTKKSSSSKKYKFKTERPNINIKKGGLFEKKVTLMDESMQSNDSNGLFRSYSSPNLFEKKEKNLVAAEKTKFVRRKLSIMKENTLLEVSGIASLEKDDIFSTPTKESGSKSSLNRIPAVVITPAQDKKLKNVLNDISVDLNVQIEDDHSGPFIEPRVSIESKEENKTATPKNNEQLIRKTSSLEKIINRFKRVRASVFPDGRDLENDIKTIAEEKENINVENVDKFTANKILLPDLLSPNCSKNNVDDFDQFCSEIEDDVGRKPRPSLGTALGVDNTFLDQFDLID